MQIRKLIIKLCLYGTICMAITTFILLEYGGNIDYFYVKFTSPKTKSMIIGDSRSLQGIQPTVINSYFKNSDLNLPILNYSFTIAQALIGPLYNESILKKIDKTSNNGLFIIAITPEMFTEHKGYNNTAGIYREEGQPPHNMNFVDINPNFEYLIKNASFFHFRSLFRKNSVVHKDGWLEELNLPTNENMFKNWENNQVKLFLKDAEISTLSEVRFKSLGELVKTLKPFGQVFIIRMPISERFQKLENKYFPEFEVKIDSIATKVEVPYFNFNDYNINLETYDGHHLNKHGGKKFTKILCDSIANQLSINNSKAAKLNN